MDRDGYAKVVGLADARKETERLLVKAKKKLSGFGPRAQVLRELSDFIVERDF